MNRVASGNVIESSERPRCSGWELVTVARTSNPATSLGWMSGRIVCWSEGIANFSSGVGDGEGAIGGGSVLSVAAGGEHRGDRRDGRNRECGGGREASRSGTTIANLDQFVERGLTYELADLTQHIKVRPEIRHDRLPRLGQLRVGQQRRKQFSTARQTRLDGSFRDPEFDRDVGDRSVGEVVEHDDGAVWRIQLGERLDQGDMLGANLHPGSRPGHLRSEPADHVRVAPPVAYVVQSDRAQPGLGIVHLLEATTLAQTP